MGRGFMRREELRHLELWDESDYMDARLCITKKPIQEGVWIFDDSSKPTLFIIQ